MGILKRFKDVMNANFEGIVEKFEKPDKMIDQYLRNLESDLGEVKAETAKVMAMEKSISRRLENQASEHAVLTECAEKAVKAGNDDDARRFLEKQAALEADMSATAKSHDVALENSKKMQEMHKKITSDISSLRLQREELIAKYTVAKTAQSMAGVTEGFETRVNGNISGFNRMKEKITFEMDKAEAAEQIAEQPDDIETLKQKYVTSNKSAEIEDRLAKLKSRLSA